MNTNKGGFTLIEVIISLCIFTILSLGFIQMLNISLRIHQINGERCQITLEESAIINDISKIIKSMGEGELTQELLDEISIGREGEYLISIKKWKYDDLFLIEVKSIEDTDEVLWALIKSM